jgi:hypothetical protein
MLRQEIVIDHAFRRLMSPYTLRLGADDIMIIKALNEKVEKI